MRRKKEEKPKRKIRTKENKIKIIQKKGGVGRRCGKGVWAALEMKILELEL